jgi:hypothetical protein
MEGIWEMVPIGYTVMIFYFFLGFGTVWTGLEWLRGWPIMPKIWNTFLILGMLIIRSLVNNISNYEDKDPSELRRRCKCALERPISRFYHLRVYPSKSGDQEERHEALAKFVEGSEALPVEKSRKECAPNRRKRGDFS